MSRKKADLRSCNIKALQSNINTVVSIFIYLPHRLSGVDQTIKIDDMLKLPTQRRQERLVLQLNAFGYLF